MALLKAGADAKAKSGVGKTAFDFAQYNLKLLGTGAVRSFVVGRAPCESFNGCSTVKCLGRGGTG